MLAEKYEDIVYDINRHKNFISWFNTDVQKTVALYMWEYVRDHLDELYDMLTEYELNNDDSDYGYGYDVVDKIKEDFCEKLRNDTGIIVDWCNHCILCTHCSNLAHISNPCENCPLGSCADKSDNPYFTLVKYALHIKSKNAALEAIDDIIRAIRGAKL